MHSEKGIINKEEFNHGNIMQVANMLLDSMSEEQVNLMMALGRFTNLAALKKSSVDERISIISQSQDLIEKTMMNPDLVLEQIFPA